MIGKKVRDFRKIRHMTLAELASRLGISDSYLSQLECGRIDPSVSLIRKLAAAFEVPIAAFFDAEYEEPIVMKYDDRAITETNNQGCTLSHVTPINQNFILNITEFQIQGESETTFNNQPSYTCIYVTEGVLTVDFDDTNALLNEGDSIYLPPGITVCLSNPSTSACKGFLCTRQTSHGGQL